VFQDRLYRYIDLRSCSGKSTFSLGLGRVWKAFRHLWSTFENCATGPVRQIAPNVIIMVKITTIILCFRCTYRISGRARSSRIGRLRVLFSKLPMWLWKEGWEAGKHTHTPLAAEHVFPTIIISFALMTRTSHTGRGECENSDNNECGVLFSLPHPLTTPVTQTGGPGNGKPSLFLISRCVFSAPPQLYDCYYYYYYYNYDYDYYHVLVWSVVRRHRRVFISDTVPTYRASYYNDLPRNTPMSGLQETLALHCTKL